MLAHDNQLEDQELSGEASFLTISYRRYRSFFDARYPLRFLARGVWYTCKSCVQECSHICGPKRLRTSTHLCVTSATFLPLPFNLITFPSYGPVSVPAEVSLLLHLPQHTLYLYYGIKLPFSILTLLYLCS